jgi:HSP20 family protein
MLARFAFNPTFPSLWREFDDLFHDDQGATVRGVTPAADIVESDKAVEIRLDMPGVSPEQIDVKLEGQQLTITAERQDEKVTQDKGFLRKERSLGRFSRAFTLPSTLDGSKPEASYRHGVLTVTLPKREEVQPRSLKVKVEA